jgi:Signal transduction histidine kinase
VSGSAFLVKNKPGVAELVPVRGTGNETAGTGNGIALDSLPYYADLACGTPVCICTRNDIPEELKQISAGCIVIAPLTGDTGLLGIVVAGGEPGDRPGQDVLEIIGAIGREIAGAATKLILYEKLAEANRKANLYLDILTHDISNVNTILLGYTGLLDETISGPEKEIISRVSEAVAKNISIVTNVETIRKIHDEAYENREIDLDAIIEKEIKLFPQCAIVFEPSGARVMADGLLTEVFTNVIGNSIKFGGPGVSVSISVLTSEKRVEVIISDTGPGIGDEMKTRIFRRFERGSQGARGKGLGLYIVKTLVERYGGRVWADDRIPGSPETGASIHFTLQRSTRLDKGGIEH